MRENLPNLLSFLRILLTPFACFSIIKNQVFLSCILVAISALSDFFDGYLARAFNCESSFGALLDPIADKIFVFSIFATFLYIKKIPLWFFSIVTLRDIMILIGASVLSKNMVNDFSPVMISKINTALLLCLSLWLICGGQYVIIWLNVITLTTLISGITYAKRFIELY